MVINKKKTIYSILYIFVLFVVLTPAALDLVPIVSKIINLCKLFLFAIAVIQLLKITKIPSSIIIILLFYFLYLFSSLLNGCTITPIISCIISAFTLLYFSYIYMKKDLKDFVKTILIYFSIICIINALSVALFPNGLYIPEDGNKNLYFFLGHRNNSIEYLLPWILFSLLYDYIFSKKTIYISYSVSLLTVILTWSVNSILALILIGLYFVVPIIKVLMQKYTNYWMYFALNIFLFFFIIICKGQRMFKWLIVGVFHKSLDFTSRQPLWNNALSSLKNKIIFGHGYDNGIDRFAQIGHINSAHNYILDLLYSGGIVMLLIMLVLIIILGKKIIKNKNKKISKIFIGIMGSYFILWFATPIHFDLMIMTFLVFFVGIAFDYNIKGDEINE